MKNLAQQSLSGIAMENQELIPVLEKYNLDYCCGGKKSLSQACAEKNIAVETILEEMKKADPVKTPVMPFTQMNAAQLIAHILTRHHYYVKNMMPVIQDHLEKVATKHGDRYPAMKKALQLFEAVQEEFTLHMQKEEEILFPRIIELYVAAEQNKQANFSPGFLNGPILMMEMEHEHAGQLMAEIRDLTMGYTPPEDACTTHRICLNELKAFEEDLHRHVHLENNILFPMAQHTMKAGQDSR
jgi:regulator of cell morphogenesis and NO signaling